LLLPCEADPNDMECAADADIIDSLAKATKEGAPWAACDEGREEDMALVNGGAGTCANELD
jgi:hypothetical protein